MSINFSFGFVEMGSEKEAEDAAKALNGTKLLGRQVVLANLITDNCDAFETYEHM